MIHTLGRLALMLGVIGILTGPAHAQRPGAGAGLGGGPFLLMAPNVQKELKLTEEQTGKIREVLQGIRQKHTDDLTAVKDLAGPERFRKQRELAKTMIDEVKKDLSLSPEQTRRFDQILLQQGGLQAFADAEV